MREQKNKWEKSCKKSSAVQVLKTKELLTEGNWKTVTWLKLVWTSLIQKEWRNVTILVRLMGKEADRNSL